MSTINKKEGVLGFTLLEAIIALGLGVLVATMMVAIVTTGLKNVRKSSEKERLHANAVYITNTLTYWIKQAQELNVTSPETLEIVLSDLSTKTITMTADDITLEGIKLNTDAVEMTDIAFTELARSVRISFGMKAMEAEETFSATTTVALRNLF